MLKQKGGGVKGLLNNVKKNCTLLTGRLPLLPWLNVFPHLGHAKGLFMLWLLLYASKVPFHLNAFSHLRHLKGLLSEWTLWCPFKATLVLNVLVQS